jgi:hypothetical protein
LFAWHGQRGLGVAVPVFRRAGMRIGFLGFPVAGADFDVMDVHELAACAAGIASHANLDLVRVAQSQCIDGDTKATSIRPEVWIDDFPEWRLADRKRLLKDLAFARRSATDVELADQHFDAAGCFELYASTVSRHGGQIRYNVEYFHALHRLAMSSSSVEFVAAVEGEKVRGFAVLAVHGGVAYYLHGAIDAAGRRQGISDLLLERLLTLGQLAGCARFTFMASPWNQPGLLRYKQKWGGVSGFARVYDFAGSLAGRGAMLVSSWQGRHDRRMARSASNHHQAPNRD